jgi:hypothetical protein
MQQQQQQQQQQQLHSPPLLVRRKQHARLHPRQAPRSCNSRAYRVVAQLPRTVAAPPPALPPSLRPLPSFARLRPPSGLVGCGPEDGGESGDGAGGGSSSSSSSSNLQQQRNVAVAVAVAVTDGGAEEEEREEEPPAAPALRRAAPLRVALPPSSPLLRRACLCSSLCVSSSSCGRRVDRVAIVQTRFHPL